jgi:hypothetical protein
MYYQPLVRKSRFFSAKLGGAITKRLLASGQGSASSRASKLLTKLCSNQVPRGSREI